MIYNYYNDINHLTVIRMVVFKIKKYIDILKIK